MQLLIDLSGAGLRDFDLEGSQRHHIVSGFALQGARTRPIIIDAPSQRMALGVSFFPGGAAPFFSLPAFELIDRLIDIEDVWGRRARSLRERLLEAVNADARFAILESALLERLQPSSINQTRASVVSCRLRERCTIGSIEEELGMHARSFVAWFKQCIGPRPKHYARLVRFQRLLAMWEEPDTWSGRALAAGFSDQAHMNREFKHFASVRPTEYRPIADLALNHIVSSTVRNIQDGYRISRHSLRRS